MTNWLRIGRAHPEHKRCPICGHDGWCTSKPSEEGGWMIRCMRKPSDWPLVAGGWIHRVDGPVDPVKVERAAQPTPRLDSSTLLMISKVCRDNLTAERLTRLADELAIPARTLRRMGLGWATRGLLDTHKSGARDQPGCFTFPMYDAAGSVVGIRTRFPNGDKRSIAGGTNGVFVPDDRAEQDFILMPEGPTDTAALIEMGFDAIGRPSNIQGGAILREMVRDRVAVVVADFDTPKPMPGGGKTAPGQWGAVQLALELIDHADEVRIIWPKRPFKDIREMVAGDYRSGKIMVNAILSRSKAETRDRLLKVRAAIANKAKGYAA